MSLNEQQRKEILAKIQEVTTAVNEDLAEEWRKIKDELEREAHSRGGGDDDTGGGGSVDSGEEVAGGGVAVEGGVDEEEGEGKKRGDG